MIAYIFNGFLQRLWQPSCALRWPHRRPRVRVRPPGPLGPPELVECRRAVSLHVDVLESAARGRMMYTYNLTFIMRVVVL